MQTKEGKKNSLNFITLGAFLLFSLFYVNNGLTGDDFFHFAHFKSDIMHVLELAFSGRFFPFEPNINYRPLTNFIFYLLSADLSPVLLRMLIVLLHLFNAYLLVTKVAPIKHAATSLSVIVFFVANSILVTNVYWVSSLGDLLIFTFCFLSFYFFFLTKRNLPLSYLFFILALFCKETALTFPLLLTLYGVLYHRATLKNSGLYVFYAIALAFLILRSNVLGHLLAGPANDGYFSFGLGTLKSLAKYSFDLISPIQIRFVIESGFYLVFVAYALVLCLLSFSKLRGGFLVSLSAFYIALLPVLNAYGSWNAYYAFGFFLVFLIPYIKDIKVPTFALPYLALCIFNFVMFAEYFKEAGGYANNLIGKLANEEVEPRQLGVPIAIYNSVPVFSSPTQAEMAIKLFFDRDIKVSFLAQVVSNGPALELERECIENSLVMEVPNPPANYFYLRDNELGRIQILQRDFGKVSRIQLSESLGCI